MDALEFRLLNEFQRDFPLEHAPYRRLAARLGSDEATVLAGLERLRAAGMVSRVGPVFAPRRVGASTLAALAAPEGELERIAARVSARPEVNHNYRREHRYNLWFVVTAADDAALAATLEQIERDTGCAVLSLPLLEEFHIDLGFDLAGVCKAASAPRLIEGEAAPALGPGERRLMAALQDGIALVPHPFAEVAARAGMEEEEVLARLRAWLAEGTIKRFGVVVRHHELGFTANAMAVWDVPDEAVCALGQRLAAEPAVTLCYRRRRHAPEWPYNLFCMIHGRARAEVEQAIAALGTRLGLDRYDHAVLFSTKRYKQRGARYALAEAANG